MIMNKYPDLILNAFIWKQFQNEKPAIYNLYNNRVPFFPVSDANAGAQMWKNQTYIVYDSFIRARSGYYKPVYAKKSGQTTYSIRGSVSSVYEWRDFMTDILDRDDVTASEVNAFGGTTYGANNGIYFECVNAYQVLAIDLATRPDSVNQQYITQLIIRYEYHPTTVYKENT